MLDWVTKDGKLLLFARPMQPSQLVSSLFSLRSISAFWGFHFGR